MHTNGDEAVLEIETLLDRKEYSAALEASSSAIKHFPDRAELYYHRAQARVLTDPRSPDYCGAIEDVAEASRLNPDEPAFRFFSGLWCFEIGNWLEAAEGLAEALQLEEALGSTYYASSARLLRALALQQLGDRNGAVREASFIPSGTSFYARSRLWTGSDIVGADRDH